ncbi:2Fe-2S iron-sulfur cluster binding domain-containing protein [Allopseudospirillum japonicum]|uniref:2Fe-2S iron-sulfur cluster binding domain-containing protein n=1 Tax=Allopseudospirillum japonicum TaxID=64971 RepID=A0A1H6RV07_9GAMM|nr:2Fe-2S iron-sulfur cluster binding domain-containing protein [Allopseudospirillum japonicum]SEI59698.1 2Fe-2S iron-sulfur cluster binding domain-containing protein [Allopseudospirillum japonicum]
MADVVLKSQPAKYWIQVLAPKQGFFADPQQSVLAAMEAAGQESIPVGCRGGGCGKCRIQIVQGQYFSKRMSRAWISAEQEAQGKVLACRVYARTDLNIQVDSPEIATACLAQAG